MNIGRIVKNKRTARLIDMETTNTLGVVSKQVRVRKMTQVVRALSHFYEVRETAYELHQAGRLAMQRFRIMQHHPDSPQRIGRQEIRQQLQAGSFIELQGSKVTIENQYLALGPAQNGIAGLAIFRFTRE